MMSAICYGQSLALPLESGSAIVHRILQSNPARSMHFIEQNLVERGYTLYFGDSALKLRPNDCRLLGNYLIYLSKLGHPKPIKSVNTECLNMAFGHKYRRRGCPQCARALYHTNLFDLPCLTHCPLHNIELTYECPQCDQEWPIGLKIRHSNCELCGLKSDYDAFLKARDTLHDESYDELDKLRKRHLEAKQPIAAHFRFPLTTKDLVTPAEFLHKKNKTLIDNNMSQCLRDSRLIYYSESDWVIKSWKLHKLSKYNKKAMRDEVNGVFHKDLNAYVISLPQELVDAKLRALQWAFTHLYYMWFLFNDVAIVEKDLKEWHQLTNNLIGYWLYFSVLLEDPNKIFEAEANIPGAYEDLAEIFPKIPFPKQYLSYQGEIYKTSVELQAYLYESDLKVFFTRIYLHFIFLERYLRSNNGIPYRRIQEQKERHTNISDDELLIMVHRSKIITIQPKIPFNFFECSDSKYVIGSLKKTPYYEMQKYLFSLPPNEKSLYQAFDDIYAYCSNHIHQTHA